MMMPRIPRHSALLAAKSTASPLSLKTPVAPPSTPSVSPEMYLEGFEVFPRASPPVHRSEHPPPRAPSSSPSQPARPSPLPPCPATMDSVALLADVVPTASSSPPPPATSPDHNGHPYALNNIPLLIVKQGGHPQRVTTPAYSFSPHAARPPYPIPLILLVPPSQHP